MLIVRAFKDLFAKKTLSKREPRRTFCPIIDENPDFFVEPADVVSLCDVCDKDTTDPPELVIIPNKVLNEYSYHVRCPKCWQCTGFFMTEKEAIGAWNRHDRRRIVI